MASQAGSTPMQPTTSSAASREPWSGAVPYLTSMMGSAEAMRNSGAGYQPWEGGSVVDLRPNANMALDQISGGSLGDWQNYGGYQGASEAINYGVNNILATGAITPHVARGWSNLDDAEAQMNDQYAKAGGNENPFLQEMLDAQNRKISDKVNSAFGGAGRYGSGQHTDIATRALAEADAPVLAQDYARRQELMRQLTGMKAGLGQTRADIGARAINQTGQWAQMMPQLNEAKYAAPMRALGVEEFRRSIDAQKLQDQAKLWSAKQAYPWEQLFRESAVVGGAGGLGGTTTTNNAQAQAPTWQRALGGALAGGGLGSSFGPWGAGAGALAGGAAGMFL